MRPVTLGAIIGAIIMAPFVGVLCAVWGALGAIGVWLLACRLVP